MTHLVQFIVRSDNLIKFIVTVVHTASNRPTTPL